MIRRIVLLVGGGLHTALYRLTGGRGVGRVGKAPVLLLTVAGRKTGKLHTTPLLYGRDGDNLIVIASVGGAPRHPAWYLNLQGQEAEVQIGRERRRVRARDAEGEERDRLWTQMLSIYGPWATYQRRTSRRIPVVVLERCKEGPARVRQDIRMAAFVTVGTGIEPGPGEVTAFEVRGEHIAVANVAGTFHAFGDLCPHRQCSLADGDLAETVITCPCHGSQFDVTTGERLRGPAVRGVPVYAVRLENSTLEIEI